MSIARKPLSDNTRRKLSELVLYIAQKCEFEETFGMTLLNKIVLFSDVNAYQRYGRTITESQYMRLANGPVPLHMKQILVALEEAGDIVVRKEDVGSYERKRVIPLRTADLTLFGGLEIAIVEEVIGQLRCYTAAHVSDLSHGIAWKVADDREIIPYTAFLLSDEQNLTPYDIEEGYRLSRQHGWENYA